ncbi:mitochondrial ribosomal protein subunit L20-domain-containing protein [Parasitella parasitica]|nr:mitochondrial ribosomal protein subunit L20-domain-containing protein [Parasitella parasitica]
MNRSVNLFISIRTYATKSKTTNLKWKPSVPVQQTTLPDGTVFIARQPVVEPSVQSAVAPLLNKPATYKKLSETEIKELRQLRESDPSTWTRSKLAKKFGCSELFVGIAASNATAQAAENQVTAVANHGYRRKLISQERQKRRALW